MVTSKLVVYLHQKLVSVKGTGNVTLPSIAGNVGKRNVVGNDFRRHRIDTVRADYICDAVAYERQIGSGIGWLGRGSSKIANSFQGRRNYSAAQECAGGLSQAGIRGKEERFVALNWTTKRASELVAMEGWPR